MNIYDQEFKKTAKDPIRYPMMFVQDARARKQPHIPDMKMLTSGMVLKAYMMKVYSVYDHE
jgi:hypothetical protein